MLLQYFDAVGWVFWPVKPTTESENRLQLGSLSTSVNIDRLTMVDSTSAVGNDSRPWVVPQSIKWLSTIMRERRIPPDSVWWISSSLRDIFVPRYRQCLTGSSWQQQQQQQTDCQWAMDTEATESTYSSFDSSFWYEIGDCKAVDKQQLTIRENCCGRNGHLTCNKCLQNKLNNFTFLRLDRGDMLV